MKIMIVGLGVIGGSYAKGLCKNHEIYGIARHLDVLEKAYSDGVLTAYSMNPDDFLDIVDLVILAIYPKDIKSFISTHKFREGQIITDVSGVKESFIYDVNKLLPKGVEFIGTHPMAGKEKKGYEYSDSKVFQNANFLITPLDNKDETIELMRGLAIELGFKRVTVMSPHHHDQVIAFTSQLTHAIAVSIMNADDDPETPNFTGDSFRDLTRIAQINEKLWSELFLENKANLVENIDKFMFALNDLKEAIIKDDKEHLEELFINSTKKRMRF